MHVYYRSNEYAACIREIFDEIPKSVFAAIAVSALTQGGDRLDAAKSRVLHEWLILHEQGIVPQKPSAKLLAKYPPDSEHQEFTES